VTTAFDTQAALLRLHLQTCVPLRLAELRRQGGPTEADWQRTAEVGQEIAEHGDWLMFRGPRQGDTARLVGKVVDAVAMLAYCPGGIDILGVHWEVKKDETGGDPG
jgi:hypothetical protein